MKCPKCITGNIADSPRFISCEANIYGDAASCNFIIWKNALAKTGLELLSDEMLENLLAGKEIPLNLISNKSGKPKPFSCGGILAEVDGRWSIKFIFADNKVSATSTPVPAKVFGEETPAVAPTETEDDGWEDDPEDQAA